jgi:hypothetical protein
MIINFGTQLGAFYTWIASKGLTYPIYSGKPIVEDASIYGFFQLVGNTPINQDDNKLYQIKKATLDFAIVASDKNVSDKALYDRLDSLSNAIVSQGMQAGETIGGVYVYSIEEGNQSGIIRDDKQNPYILAEFYIVYRAI